MVSVYPDSVNVPRAGKDWHVLRSLVMHAAISMVHVLLGPVFARRAGAEHTAHWMSVLVHVQAMDCAPTVLLVCPGHVSARMAGLELTAPHSWRWSVMISLTMMKVNRTLTVIHI